MKTKLVPVKDEDGLFRDIKSNAIINMDNVAYTEYKKKKYMNDIKKAKQWEKEQEINILKSDIKELKEMLNLILEKLYGNN